MKYILMLTILLGSLQLFANEEEENLFADPAFVLSSLHRYTMSDSCRETEAQSKIFYQLLLDINASLLARGASEVIIYATNPDSEPSLIDYLIPERNLDLPNTIDTELATIVGLVNYNPLARLVGEDALALSITCLQALTLYNSKLSEVELAN